MGFEDDFKGKFMPDSDAYERVGREHVKAWHLVQEEKHKVQISIAQLETQEGESLSMRSTKNDLRKRAAKLQEIEDFLATNGI